MVGGVSGCVLSTGTDEHGIKIQQAAAKRGCTPQAHCDEMSPQFEVIKKFEPIFRNLLYIQDYFCVSTSYQE